MIANHRARSSFLYYIFSYNLKKKYLLLPIISWLQISTYNYYWRSYLIFHIYHMITLTNSAICIVLRLQILNNLFISHSNILVFLQFQCITINLMFYIYHKMIKLKVILFMKIGIKNLCKMFKNKIFEIC